MNKKNQIDLLLIIPPNNLDAVMGLAKRFINGSVPFGTLYIAAVAEEHGRKVEFLDAFTLGLGIREIADQVRDRQPRLVGISSVTADAAITVLLCKEIRKTSPGTPIVLGGAHPREFPDYFLNENLADFVCMGEGEYVTLDLLDKLGRGGSFDDVLGIAWSPRKGEVKLNLARPLIPDLDQLPMPARHLAPMEKYGAPFYFHNGRKAEGLITSRGCPNRCTFCCVHGGVKPRYRSAPLMAQEFDLLTQKYGYDFISFQDSLFMGNRSRIYEFCDIMKRRPRVAPWNCEGHINFINEKLLSEMKKGGCGVICFGIESGVQRLLDSVNKKIKLERVAEAVKMTKAAGIKAYGLFMLGLPGETPKDTYQTIQLAKSLPLDFAQFSLFTPYPGSQLFYDLVGEGRIDPMDWNRYSAYVFGGDTKPIYTPDGRGAGEMKKWQQRAMMSFFLRPKVFWDQVRKIRRGEDLLTAFGMAWSIIGK